MLFVTVGLEDSIWIYLIEDRQSFSTLPLRASESRLMYYLDLVGGKQPFRFGEVDNCMSMRGGRSG